MISCTGDRVINKPAKLLLLIAYVGCFLLFSSCALKKGAQKRYRLFLFGRGRGVYHTVSKGQTLWRIARIYGVNIEKVARYNRLDDKSDIKVGEKLYIPGAVKVLYVSPHPTSSKTTDVSSPKQKTTKKSKSLPLPENVSKSQRIELVWPIKGKVTSGFGAQGGTHFGIDIASSRDTPIKAAAGGRVSYVGYQPLSYGNFVIIQHPGNYATVYAHNSRNFVKVGQKVIQGMTIGYVGSTGNSTGNHLHFEIRYKRKARNPLWYLPRL